MKIQFLGQNSFVISLKEHTLITDPAISINPLSKNVNIGDIHPDYILLTHAHGDHVADVVPIATKNSSTIISNYEVATYYGTQGLKYHPMNHGGKWDFDFGTIAMVNAIHTSSFPDGSNGGNPCGFVIMADDKTIYVAGDTALTYDMKIIPLLYPKLDLAILPIGDNFTMGIEGAIQAAKFVKCNEVLGCHYDTFPFIEIDHDHAKESFEQAGINLTLLEIEKSITL